MKFIFLICFLTFLSCARPEGSYFFPSGSRTLGIQNVDDCGMHVGRYGVPLTWNDLPVPITIHEQSVNKSAISTIVRVSNEWNDEWKDSSGQDTGLFEILGLIDYSNQNPLLAIADGENTIIFIDSHSNRYGNEKGDPTFFQAQQQGVTKVLGRFSMSEADIFINDDNFEFFYEDDEFLARNKKAKKRERMLASTSPPTIRDVINFTTLKVLSVFRMLFNFLTFKEEIKREPDSRRNQIPRGSIDFESLITHEMGHVLGLGHNEKKGSIMNKKLGRGVVRRGLRPIDLDSLLCSYGKN